MSEQPENYRTKKSTLLDTCFIIHEIMTGKTKKFIDYCEKNNVLLTSFNKKELEHVSKKIKHGKPQIKHFLDQANIKLIDIPVSPGNKEEEYNYVHEFDPELLKKVKDPSDAVLVVVGIKSKSDILTRDKHHLFTTQLEQELQKYNINVYSEISTQEKNQ